jgi:ADP-heptose:LPS heptosyltransferase
MSVAPIPAVTPEIQISVITEQKCAERLHLFKFFTKSVIRIIHNLQTTSKKALINGMILIKYYSNMRLIISLHGATAGQW